MNEPDIATTYSNAKELVMPTSEARLQANQKNALRSTGPKTTEGKAISRQNGLKHGLTGAGIVLAEADQDEVARRNTALQAELAPSSTLGEILVRKMATLSIRMEKSSQQETAAIATRVRHARDDFDLEQLDEADRLFNRLHDEPRTSLRRLKNFPEGVERLLGAWRELRDELIRDPQSAWTPQLRERAENLTGRRLDETGSSRIGELSKAIWGDTSVVLEGVEFSKGDRVGWARELLIERISAEMAALEAAYDNLDFKTFDLDRAEAPDRVLFDPSREATLARRYEAEATRGFYKALKELREAEAEAAELRDTVVSATPERGCGPLGSSWESRSPAIREPQPAPGFTRPTGNFDGSDASRQADGAVIVLDGSGIGRK